MKKIMIIAFGFLVSCSALANPAPFGLELDKATEKKFKDKFTESSLGVNLYSHGNMYSVPAHELGLSGLKSSTFIFDTHHKLVGVLLTLPKTRFDSLMSSLSSKYRIKEKQIHFVGTKKAVFTNGNAEITMLAPHLSFEMSLNYITKKLLNAFEDQQRKNREAAKQKESSAL